MNTDTGITDREVEKALDFIRDNAALIGQLKGNKEYIAYRIKIERAERYLDAEGTINERESIAWTDPSVARLCEEYRDCLTELHTIETLFKAAELKIEVWRTQNANQRRGHM